MSGIGSTEPIGRFGTVAPRDMDERLRAIMSVVVTLFLLALAAVLLTSPNGLVRKPVPDGWEKAAIGWIGFVIGYWLK